MNEKLYGNDGNVLSINTYKNDKNLFLYIGGSGEGVGTSFNDLELIDELIETLIKAKKELE